MNEPCFPFDPVERLATEISNLRRVGFNYRQVYKRLFPGWLVEWKKNPVFHGKSPTSIYKRVWWAVEGYYGRKDLRLDGGWSDYIGWIYTDQEYSGEYYEQEIYPTIKNNSDIFTQITMAHKKEKLAYPKRDAQE